MNSSNKVWKFDEKTFQRDGIMLVDRDLSHRRHNSTEELVCTVHGDLEAARLIAAAPELLEALQKAGEAFDTLSESLQDKHLDLIMLIAETLDKARGE